MGQGASGRETYQDPYELIADPEIDVVDICTPILITVT